MRNYDLPKGGKEHMLEDIVDLPEEGVYILFQSTPISRLRGGTNIFYIGGKQNLQKVMETETFKEFVKEYHYTQLLFYERGNSKVSEEKLLKEFEMDHLELPPLNRLL